LAEHRRATLLLRIAVTPDQLHDWGALGGVVGRIAGDYWQVPALIGIDRVPASDELKHLGAAMASFGSVAMFHMLGVTPEAQRLNDIADASLTANVTITAADLRAFKDSYRRHVDTVDVVVFSTPQLSLLELRDLAAMLDGRRATIPLLVVTSPQVKPDADRFGITARIEAAGGLVLSGMCFYQSYAREMAEANGWQALATNSAKLVNILGGYGYRPALLSMEACVDAACTGRIVI
jgi:predicted aconitase